MVVAARLVVAKTDVVLSRYTDWPQPFRFVDFPDPGLKAVLQGNKIRLEVERPVKGLVLSVEGDEQVKWSDNALDVNPGDPQDIVFEGLGDRRILVSYMGKEVASPLLFQ